MNSWLSLVLASVIGALLTNITQPMECRAILKGVAIALAWGLGYISGD